VDDFDPKQSLHHLQAVYGVPRVLAHDFEEYRQRHVLHRHPQACLAHVLECIISGWNEPLEALMDSGERAAHASIAEHELGEDQSFELSGVHLSLGMFHWLRNDVHTGELPSAIGYLDRYYEKQRTLSKAEVSLSLSSYLCADADSGVITLFERSGLKPPKSARAARTPAMVAYIVAQHRLHGVHSRPDVEAAIASLFEHRYSKEWLAHGHFAMAGEWIKGALWKPGESAIAMIRSCNVYIPCYPVT
jgi:hypothetical protein